MHLSWPPSTGDVKDLFEDHLGTRAAENQNKDSLPSPPPSIPDFWTLGNWKMLNISLCLGCRHSGSTYQGRGGDVVRLSLVVVGGQNQEALGLATVWPLCPRPQAALMRPLCSGGLCSFIELHGPFPSSYFKVTGRAKH